jgi:hypothetical protein
VLKRKAKIRARVRARSLISLKLAIPMMSLMRILRQVVVTAKRMRRKIPSPASLKRVRILKRIPKTKRLKREISPKPMRTLRNVKRLVTP